MTKTLIHILRDIGLVPAPKWYAPVFEDLTERLKRYANGTEIEKYGSGLRGSSAIVFKYANTEAHVFLYFGKGNLDGKNKDILILNYHKDFPYQQAISSLMLNFNRDENREHKNVILKMEKRG